ncbi:MAG TPA: hemerythrin domain-containing protein [Terriglobia bacterium]|jgi:hemerythrin-like domain-containing protein
MAAKSRKRSNTGQSRKDAIALLKEDHKNVKGLLQRLEKTTEDDTEERDELLAEVETEITVHTQIEEEIFYPAFKDAIRQESQARLYFEALEEHHVVDLVMPEIKSTDTASEKFAAKAKVLKDLIEHHAEQEETEMFPKARKTLGAARLRELGQELADRKSELMADMESDAA